MLRSQSLRDFEPHAEDWRSFAWGSGCFDTAFRPKTRSVEGSISLDQPTVIAILSGGCSRIEIASECGRRYQGPDFAGSVSFIPAGCKRQIKMTDVETEWASFSIRADLICQAEDFGEPSSGVDVPVFTNQRDMFLHALLSEFRRLYVTNERLDSLYCEAMAVSAALYILRRYGERSHRSAATGRALQGWRLRRAKDYIRANLENPELRLDDVARCIGLSTGFFHRAFKETTGETPLAYIQRQRIGLAMQLLSVRDLSVMGITLRVGFSSPSYFSRLFRRQVGMTPTQYREQWLDN